MRNAVSYGTMQMGKGVDNCVRKIVAHLVPQIRLYDWAGRRGATALLSKQGGTRFPPCGGERRGSRPIRCYRRQTGLKSTRFAHRYEKKRR